MTKNRFACLIDILKDTFFAVYVDNKNRSVNSVAIFYLVNWVLRNAVQAHVLLSLHHWKSLEVIGRVFSKNS